MKKFLILMSVLLAFQGYGADSKKIMKIDIARQGELVTIYEGKMIPEVSRVLRGAKKISVNKLEKAIIIEGTYYMEIYEHGLKEKYSIQNRFWIYDELHDVFYRCDLLHSLRDIYFKCLVDNNILPA